MCDFGFPPIPLNRSFLDILYLSDFLDSLYLVRQEVGSVRSESGILTRAGAAPREHHQLAGTWRGILTIIFLPPTTRYSRLSVHNTVFLTISEELSATKPSTSVVDGSFSSSTGLTADFSVSTVFPNFTCI